MKFNLADKIKAIDFFGRRITLTYQGEDRFKTVFGGVLFLVFVVVTASLACSGLIKIFTFHQESISS